MTTTERCPKSMWLSDKPVVRVTTARGLAWAAARMAACPGGQGFWGPFQAPVVAIRCWWSFNRLCVMAANRHSDRTAVRPLRWNLSIRRLYLICPNTGSIVL
jgi:hypothetical protein